MGPVQRKQKPAWMILDGLFITLSILMAFVWKFFDSTTSETLIHVYLIPLSLIFRWILYSYFHLYDFSKQETFLDQVYSLFWAGTLATVGDWLVLLILKTYYLGAGTGVSREIILNSWGLILITSSLWRYIYLLIRKKKGEHICRVAIVGCGPTAVRVHEEIRKFSGEDLNLIGFIPTGEVCPEVKTPVLGSLDCLETLLDRERIDDLILAPEASERTTLLDLISRCEATTSPVRVRLHPDLAELYVGKVVLSHLAGLPLVEVPDRWRSGFFLRVKRIVDSGVSIIGLILLIIPGILVGLCIKLEGLFRPEAQGPILFIQRRLGQNRKPFQVVKFRTMIRSAEKDSGPILATLRDPRITLMGRFLRRTGIDELPQLWNVLKGEMSLVGPRPERPEFIEDFLKEHPSYALRFRLRPGITGLAQIHGHYDSSVPSKLRYDMVYLANFSLFLDLKILFHTIQVILTGRKIK